MVDREIKGIVELDLDNPEESIKEIELDELEDIKERSIIKINTRSTWNNIKKLSRQYHRTKNSFKIFISKEVKLTGKVTHKEFDSLQKIALMKEVSVLVKGEGGEPDYFKNKIFFLDEDIDRRKLNNITDSYDVEFWFYKFKSENQEYVLLVNKNMKLDFEEYNIEGTLINLPDYADVGKYSKILLQRPLILLHNAKKRIPKFKDNKEFFDKIKELELNKENNFRHFIFGGRNENDGKYYYYSNPKEYEDLITTVLLSCIKDGYPLHMLGIGEGGCGKSTTLETLHSKTGERSIFEGSTSTFKLLIPSYRTSIVNIGFMFESNRFCFTDEFLRVLMRVDKDDRTMQLTYLNDILEHKKRIRGSGNSSFEGKMSSKFIGVTNPAFGTRNMVSLVKKFEESITTFSRMLIFYYNQDHVKFVNTQKKEKTKIRIKPIDRNDFLGIYDYMYNLECDLDDSKINEVFDRIRGYLTSREEYSRVLEMFDARYTHHVECLLDGIVKARCILELDESFKAEGADYEKLEEMLKYVLRGWGIDIIKEIKIYKTNES